MPTQRQQNKRKGTIQNWQREALCDGWKIDCLKNNNRVIVDKLFEFFPHSLPPRLKTELYGCTMRANGENDSNICYLFYNLLKMQTNVEPEMESKPTIKQVNERVLKMGKYL